MAVLFIEPEIQSEIERLQSIGRLPLNVKRIEIVIDFDNVVMIHCETIVDEESTRLISLCLEYGKVEVHGQQRRQCNDRTENIEERIEPNGDAQGKD